MSIPKPGSRFPRPSTPLRAVAFDLDGLMFNTEDLYEHVGTEVLRRRGKEFSHDLLQRMIGLRTPVALRLMIDELALDDTVESLRAESDEVFLEILPTQLRTMPGLLELLDALETAGIPRGIATSSPRAFADRVLSQFDLAPRFGFLLAAEDVHDGKPAPEIYERAAKLAGVEPAAMLVLEDSAVGSRAGLAAGAYTIAVPQGHTARQDFSGVHFIADTLADPRILEVLRLADAND